MATLSVGGAGPVNIGGLKPPPPPVRLPPLREELRLLPAAPNHDGSPAWMVQDPVNNRFFRIGWVDFEVLLRWGMAEPKAIAEAISAETTLDADGDDVMGLLAFLDQHSLLRADSAMAVDKLRSRKAMQKRGPYEWLLHNYLFFRVPLVRPQDGLARAMPYLNWIYTRTTAFAVIGLTLLGLFLAARQWETFTSTIVDHLSWSGIVGYAVALVFAKTLHELGHAVTATRYGVRVAHMGVAMLVMFPMLYTDTSESWKLTRSRQRLAIASAGLITEMALAGLCTLGWALSPDGPVGNGLFFLATTSWVLTLLINVSPFMRFDGYFILTDILDFPNLHERGGALARTWMRRTLLGFEDEYPERLPGRGNALAIAFALTTWVYRLTVFLGIALLVYHFAFKLLGIFLMGVELVWFIGKPVANELGVWRKRKSEIKPNRKVAGWALLAVVLAVLMVPWPTAVHGPGWVHPERQQQIFSPLAGRITAVPKEGAVTQGQLLFALESPDLKLSEQRSTDQAAARAQELLGLSGLPDGEERRAQIRSQQDKFLAEASMYTGEQSRLQVAAPFTGQLGDLDPLLTPGVWVQPRQPLAIVTDPSRWTVEAFIEEEDVARVRVGDSARVYIGMRSLETVHGSVVEVDPGRTQSLPHAMLDANAGGPIVTVKPPAEQRYLERPPRDAIYRVRIALDAPPRGAQMMLAKVVIAGEGRAWLPTVLRKGAAVLVRESGF